MREKVLKLLAAHPEVQLRDADLEKVITEIERRMNMIGERITNRVNGVEIDWPTFERIVFGIAGGMLKPQNFKKLIPRFVDGRTPTEKQRNKDDFSAIIDVNLEKLGYVYIGQHLGEDVNLNTVKNLIADDGVYGGSGPEGELVYYRFKNGFFSKPFSMADVISHYSQPFLDVKRTHAKQQEIYRAAEKEVLQRNGYDKRKDVPKNAVELIEDEIKEQLTPKAYSKRRINFDSSLYFEEMQKIEAFRHGIVNPASATLGQKRAMEEFAKMALKELDTLPRVAVKPVTTFEEPAKIPFENVKGVALTIDQL